LRHNRRLQISFLISLLSRRESNHRWAADQALRLPPPWKTCEAALSEAFYLLGTRGDFALAALSSARKCGVSLPSLRKVQQQFLKLMQKYADVPMSFADALLGPHDRDAGRSDPPHHDTDFSIYRRHSRQTVLA